MVGGHPSIGSARGFTKVSVHSTFHTPAKADVTSLELNIAVQRARHRAGLDRASPTLFPEQQRVNRTRKTWGIIFRTWNNVP